MKNNTKTNLDARKALIQNLGQKFEEAILKNPGPYTSRFTENYYESLKDHPISTLINLVAETDFDAFFNIIQEFPSDYVLKENLIDTLMEAFYFLDIDDPNWVPGLIVKNYKERISKYNLIQLKSEAKKFDGNIHTIPVGTYLPKKYR